MDNIYISPRADIYEDDLEVIEAMTEALIPTSDLIDELFKSVTKNAKPFTHLLGVYCLLYTSPSPRDA